MTVQKPLPFLPSDRRASLAAARELVVSDIIRTGICTMLSRFENRPLHETAKRYYGGSERSFQLVEKASTSPATSTTAAWAGNVTAVGQGTLAALSPQAAFVKVLQRCPQAYQFNHSQRKVMVPSLLANNTDLAFLTEGGMIPVIGSSVSAATLEPRTLPVIAVFTREALTRSLPNAETELTRKLAKGINLVGDKFMFDAVAGDTTRPPGILAGITPTTASNATPADQAMRADIAAITAAVCAVSGEQNIILVANPKQANAYALEYPNGAPFEMFRSSALALGTVVAIATNAIAHAVDATPTITIADQGGMVHMDSAPQIGFAAATVYSLWQTDMVGVRVVADVDWAVISTSGIALVNSVTW